jgi:ectoine hydroxylase-related dioxygenase (phytanoyl-CoA dioxygenase family)
LKHKRLVPNDSTGQVTSISFGQTGPMAVGNQSTVAWRVIDDVRLLADAVQRPGYEADPAEIATFQRDGVVLLRGAFAEWVPAIAAGFQRNLEHPASYAFPSESTFDHETGRFFDSYCNWQRIPEYTTFVLNSKAAAMAAAFMGSEIAQLFHEHAFCKEPGTQKQTPWHQDLPYYCVDGQQTISIYMALDPTPAETAVRFLKGSHRTGQLHRPRDFMRGNEYETSDPTMVSTPEITDGDDVFAAALEPGDTLLFDFRTLHGTTDAPIEQRRRAFSTRWLGDDVRYVDRPGETSPPMPDLGLRPGEPMRQDWFPVLWPNSN